jgi:FAD/FMN-containing dehydrogenase
LARPVLQPSSVLELQSAIRSHRARLDGQLCVVGKGLSPNGMSFGSADDRALSLSRMARVLHCDDATRRVTVEAGIDVRSLQRQLRSRGWSLPLFASIDEQNVVGMMHSGTHTTGIAVPPSEEWQTKLQLMDAAGKLHTFSRDENAAEFDLVRLSLGLLGVVVAVELQCTKLTRVVRHTSVTSRAELARNHSSRLQKFAQVRHFYFPGTDCVVLTTLRELAHDESAPEVPPPALEAERERAALSALLELHRRTAAPGDASQLSSAKLRCAILATDPHNVELVRRVSDAEAAYFQFFDRFGGVVACGEQQGLQTFDCGLRQFVTEVAHVASTARDKHADLSHAFELLDLAERRQVPLPGPVEQRWTAASAARLSPAGLHRVPSSSPPVFSWLGTLMYLPESTSSALFKSLAARHSDWVDMWRRELWSAYDCAEHWGKISLAAAADESEHAERRSRLARQFPGLLDFRALRRRLDPDGIFGPRTLNNLIA